MQKSAVFFYIQALGDVDCVIVAMRGEKALLAETRGEFERSVTFDAQGESWAAGTEARGIADAVEPHAFHLRQTSEHAIGESSFVSANGTICHGQSSATIECANDGFAPSRLCGVLPAYLCQIINAGRDTCDALVIQSSPLPPLRHGICIGADFVCRESRQMIALAVEHAH